MLTCKQMSELGTDIIDSHLSWRTRGAAILHLQMCSRCSRYIRQLRLTSQVLQQLPLEHEPVDFQAVLDRLDTMQGSS